MMLWIWLGLLVAFIVIEACTAQLVTIWFAVGAFAAFITSLFTESILWQIGVFVIISVIALIVTRPLVRRFTKKGQKTATNADMYIHSEGIVQEEIDNISAKGLVKVKGSVWTARSTDDAIIPEGARVTVERIEGVKLIVKQL